jgi:hypothetical protein
MKNVDEIVQLADNYQQCCQEMVKIARVRKLPNGKWRVLSQKGKNLGTFDSERAAKKHLKEVEYFKHLDKSNVEDDISLVIDLTKAEEFAYSAIMRQMRQKAPKNQVKIFLKLFKLEFDKAVKNKLKKPERVALQNALVKFDKIHKIKLDKKLIKNASVSELGDSVAVGTYLANIVHFILNRVPSDKRLQARDNLKQKFALMGESEIASKHLPDSAAIAQSITFVKHVLFNHDAGYIREVLNSLVSAL